jgi:F-type H+-transporting ATPase subunit a
MATETTAPAHAPEAGGATVDLDPMHQFHIDRLVPIDIGGIDASFTNASLWMVIAAGLVVLLLLAAPTKLVPTRLQSVGEIAYEFIANMMRDILGEAGRPFFPFVFTLFMFILAANMLGMVPYSFTVTSHIIVTAAMALFVFFMVTIIGIARHGFHFFSYFVPKGAPLLLVPVMIPIEILSYFIRPLSLSVRLFANMVAGHVMLTVVGGFVFALGIWAGWIPLAFVTVLFGLELLIACLQAYVFTILTCIYLHDAIHLH